MSLKSLTSWIKDCGIANEIPISTYIKMVKEAVEIANQLQAELDKHRWIPVSERLPVNIATVWILLNAKATDSLSPSMGFYGENENGWEWEILGVGILDEVTHWKPIILPKE